MNSTEELSAYRDASQSFYSPTKKTAYFEYDFTDDKPAKKEKKWSFGNLFRRKKKTNDSSSDEEVKKTLENKKKRKGDVKKKPVTFDHVVITQPQVRYQGDPQNNHDHVFSDTSDAVSRHANRIFDASPKTQQTFPLGNISSRNHPNQLSLDSVSRKSKRGLAKVRAEARRTSFNQSSSDEDSQRSTSSHKFRSDESLPKLRESAKKTRAARTERYLKRHSRDGENPNNYLRLSKSDAESSFLKLSDDSTRSPSASPSQIKLSYSSISSQSPSVLGLSTIPPSHVNHSKFRVSNSTSNPSYKPPLSINDYNSTAKSNFRDTSFNNQRSISFDANIHRPQIDTQIIHAKLELGKPRARNLTIVDGSQVRQYYNMQQPPPPPPRDPRRLHSAQYLDTVNQNDTNFDTSPVQMRYSYSKENSIPQVRKLNLNPTFKSSSEDHIPRGSQVSLAQRPSSATPESNNRWNLSRPDNRSRSDNYQYLTDKQPRSRKPIFIQNGINKSLSQREIKDEIKIIPDNKGSTAFLDQLRAKKSNRNSRGSCSPQMFSCETSVQTKIFLPSVLPNNNPEDVSKTLETDVKNDLDIMNRNTKTEENDTVQRKSTNLEEALNELEAIYNSLKLGDEDLLDMAEKREKEVATQRMLESRGPMWHSPRGTLSDSGFNYEPFDTIDASRRKRYSRKSLRSDDMAFRKINREDRASTINDPQNVASKISYLLTSPIYSGNPHSEAKTDPNEPDITLDDVVYRNIKQSNKLKVPEHPPPFGIPLGPIALAANSDYLHAVPDTETVKPSRIPDLVKDDLAFRNLRKDSNKEPALPPVSSDDLKNNNLNNNLANIYDPPRMDISEMRKNRAIRSKSANIGSLISQEVIERASRRNARDKNIESEYKTLTDIADAMQIARQVLKEKEMRITENKRASMSDTDAGSLRYTRYPQMKSVDSCSREVISSNVKYRSPKLRDLEEKAVRSQVKESTPDPVSSFEDCRLRPLFRTTSFEDALTALAIEAKEASDKFTQDLKELDAERKNKDEGTVEGQSDFSSEPVNLCKKLLEAVVDSTQHITTAETEEIKEDPEMMKSFASIVFSTSPKKRDDPVESDHDYENLASDKVVLGEDGKKSPFEECKDQLVTAFKELNIENDEKDSSREPAAEEPDYCNLNVQERRKSQGEQ
ncbi:hypothetical protein HHI36_020244 [Cryptolaemus montrouzieri]|uniref:Supervillin n=1 Tax=Cryptolaemus montrouzieri TaxID=559131 RepID=A0ABD2NA51_9CUCU